MKSFLTHLSAYPAPVRILVLLLLLGIVWLPIAIPLALVLRDPNTITIVTMSLLFVGFLGLIQMWGRQAYHNPRILQTYGLMVSGQNLQELGLGLAIGFVSLFGMYLIQGWLGWIRWQSLTGGMVGIVLQGALTGLGVALAEELVFRGWILEELQRDYSAKVSLWADSLIFAGLHFIKPIPEIIRTWQQFPGLVLLGLSLVWARRATARKIRSTHSVSIHAGRLGLPIGLHGGLVWGNYILHVGNLVDYSDHIPSWLTGIDRNPLSSVTGLLFLTGLAAFMSYRSRQAQMRLRSAL